MFLVPSVRGVILRLRCTDCLRNQCGVLERMSGSRRRGWDDADKLEFSFLSVRIDVAMRMHEELQRPMR
jgi:hypothetical protein